MKHIKGFLLTLIMSIFMLLSCTENKFDKTDFGNYPVYSGDDLEASYTPEKTSFRIWAPTADEAKVLIYKDGKVAHHCLKRK